MQSKETKNINSTIADMAKSLDDAKNVISSIESDVQNKIKILFNYETASAIISLLEEKYNELSAPGLDVTIWDETNEIHEDMSVSPNYTTSLGWRSTSICTEMTHIY